MKLLLWDIDGTLLNSDKAGMYAWLQALAEEHGEPITAPNPKMAGMTDRLIAHWCIERILGRPVCEHLVSSLLARYVELLPGWLEQRQDGRVLPGVRAVLEATHARSDIVSALLTGNIERGGRLKLAHYELWDFFEWGAFADVAVTRRDIARWARREAEVRYGENLEAIYVIGDTEHDVDCGKTIDARTIAVATGPLSATELASHEPWWAVDVLPNPQDFLAHIG